MNYHRLKSVYPDRGKITMERIQRKRTKGWKMPSNTIYVGRPTKWGNHYSVKKYGRVTAIVFYRKWLDTQLKMDADFLDELKGKNLACWCKLDEPCHADILLKLARSPPRTKDTGFPSEVV